MKRVIIAPHMRCNATCAHCCVSSNPRDNRKLSDEVVYRLVDEAIANSSVEVISFTGGEALLRRNFILDLIKRVTKGNKKSTLVSNGFWAVTPKVALLRLTELRDAGLSLLTLSADTFHLPYIPLKRIENILEVLPEVPGIKINLNMCESKSNNADIILDQLGDAIKEIPVTRFPITPVGAASTLPNDEVIYKALSTDALRCPGYTLLFSSDDRVYPCCSTGIMNSALSIGRASELTIESAAKRIEKNLLFYIISQKGFSWIVDQFRSMGVEKFQKPFKVVDACDLCRHIFESEADLLRLQPILEQYRKDYLLNKKAQIEKSSIGN